MQAYVAALEITAGTETRVRADFRAQLDSQAQTIISLQQHNAALESDLSAQEDSYKAKIGDLNGEVLDLKQKLEKAQETAANAVIAKEQADKIAALATDKAEQLTAEVQQLTDKADQSDTYKAAADEANAELEKLKTELSAVRLELKQAQETAAAQIATAQTQHERELALEVKAARAEVREKYQDRIDLLQQQHSDQIKAIQEQHAAQITELIEQRKEQK